MDECRTEISQILYDGNVPHSEILVLRRKGHDDPEPFSEIHDPVCISATETDGTNSEWIDAYIAIREVCGRHGVPDINVEIAHEDGLRTERSFVLEPTHALAQGWAHLRPHILRLLGDRDWLSVDILRRGIRGPPRNNPAAIVVTIDSASIDDWSSVTTDITKLLDTGGYDNVAVQIGRGRIRRGWGDEDVSLEDDSWQMPTLVGRSVGIGGDNPSAGTLGGFLRLVFANGSTKVVGVTCYHVVYPEKSKKVREAQSTKEPGIVRESQAAEFGEARDRIWDRYGIRPDDARNKIVVEQPSRMDFEDNLKDAEDRLRRLDNPARMALTQ